MMGILFALLFLAPIAFSIPIALTYRIKRCTEIFPYLSVIGIFTSLLISIYIFLYVDGKFTYHWIPGVGINFVLICDHLSKYMGLVTALIAFLIGVYGLEYMEGDYRPAWYWFLFNLFTASMLLVVYSDNLFLLFIGWEGLGIASWGLIGHWHRDDDEITYVGEPRRKVGLLDMCWTPSAGGWRAISTIRLGDVSMFLSIAAIWFLAGNLNISEIQWGSLFVKVGYAGTATILAMFLIGLLTKSAQVPFSEWLMTAMTGPTTVSALLHSATMVAAGAYVFMRISWYIEPWALHGVPGLEIVYIFAIFIGLVSGLYGALCASGMLERKVLLASSTMSSLGLMFGVTAGSFWIGKLAILAGFWYLIVHAFAKATLFLVSGHLIHATDTRFSVGDYKFGKKMKTAFAATVIATTFLVGIPPLTGYWVKSAMDEIMHHLLVEWGMIAPICLLLATSVVYSAIMSRFFSLNFVKGERPTEEHLEHGKVMAGSYAVMVSMLFVILYLISYEKEISEFIPAGFAPASLAVGIGVLISYVIALYRPRIRALSRNLGVFFNDRMYLMGLNDVICRVIGFSFASGSENANRGFDGFFNTRVIPRFFDKVSRVIRSIQTGYLTTYVMIVVGIVIAIFIIISIGVTGI